MDNYNRILDCALKNFAKYGYDAVGVQAITDESGITKPTLYHYFKSKRGLLKAVLKREMIPFLEKLAQATEQGHLEIKLENITRAYFDLAVEKPDFYRLQLSMQFSSPESESCRSIFPYMKEQYELIEKVFFQAAEIHGNLRGYHRKFAVCFLGRIHALIALYFNQRLEIDNETVYQSAHQFLHGIFS